MSIARILLRGLFQHRLRLIKLLQIKQRDALIQHCNLERRIFRSRILKRFQRLFEELLIHVRSAQIIESRCFGRISGRSARSKRRKNSDKEEEEEDSE